MGSSALVCRYYIVGAFGVSTMLIRSIILSALSANSIVAERTEKSHTPARLPLPLV